MMAKSSSEKQRAEENYIDRMSTLPDNLLCHILSFLSTKTCVIRMSLVSRRYRSLWKHLDVLDFHDMASDNSKLFKDFTVFVNAVLALRRSRHVRKMRLSCAHSFYHDSVCTWLRTAAGSHLEELNLTFFFRFADRGFHLPLPILTSINLVNLTIQGDLSLELKHSVAIFLPSLKTLKLQIGFVDMDSLNILLSACDILQTLKLGVSSKSYMRVRVPPSLKWLDLKVFTGNQIGTYLEIDTPDLKYLRITHTALAGAIGNLHNVDEAYLSVFPTVESESVEPLLNLLQALSGVKQLVVHLSTTEWLLSALDIDFLEHRNLLHLDIDLPFFNLSFLFNMLQKCPMLQTLKIQNIEDISAHGCFPQPTSVPECVLSHLTHLTYIHFKGSEVFADELAFVEYILQNGLVLKVMSIIRASSDKQNTFSGIPRGSDVYQLKFD